MRILLLKRSVQCEKELLSLELLYLCEISRSIFEGELNSYLERQIFTTTCEEEKKW